MAIRVYKPTNAGRRNASVSDFSDVTRSTPEKSLVRKLSKTGGRNSYGRMTSRHRGGGHKRQYRLIDFRRWDKDGVPAKVARVADRASVDNGRAVARELISDGAASFLWAAHWLGVAALVVVVLCGAGLARNFLRGDFFTLGSYRWVSAM